MRSFKATQPNLVNRVKERTKNFGMTCIFYVSVLKLDVDAPFPYACEKELPLFERTYAHRLSIKVSEIQALRKEISNKLILRQAIEIEDV